MEWYGLSLFFRPYIHGREFTVVTDHRPLKWLMTLKDPNGRLARWALKVQDKNMKIEHRPGTQHANADALSRDHPDDDMQVSTQDSEDSTIHIQTLFQPDSSVDEPRINAICLEELPFDKISEEQRKDAAILEFLNYLEQGELPSKESRAKQILLLADQMYLDNNILYKLNQPSSTSKHAELQDVLVAPKSLHADILAAYHDAPSSAHLGFNKTVEKIRERFWWPHMLTDIKAYIAGCPSCNSYKNPKVTFKAPLNPLPTASEPFELVGIDYIGPIRSTSRGNQYLLVLVDHFTKWVEAFPTKNASAILTANILTHQVFCRHGLPTKILTDRGKNFVGEVMSEVYKLMGIKKLTTSAYHPQTNGLTERFNGTLIKMLAHYTKSHQRDWDLHVNLVLFAYRTSKHASTGETPFSMLYGRKARLPLDSALLGLKLPRSRTAAEYQEELVTQLQDSWKWAKHQLDLAKQQQEHYYNQDSVENPYEVGDQVWLMHKKVGQGLSPKLAVKWTGPWILKKQTSPITFILKATSGLGLKLPKTPVHINRLKPYVEPFEVPESPVETSEEIPVLEEDEELPEVENQEPVFFSEPQVEVEPDPAQYDTTMEALPEFDEEIPAPRVRPSRRTNPPSGIFAPSWQP